MFSEELRDALKKAGVSQTDFAKMTETPLRTLQHWIEGTRTPSAFVQKSMIEIANGIAKEKEV